MKKLMSYAAATSNNIPKVRCLKFAAIFNTTMFVFPAFKNVKFLRRVLFPDFEPQTQLNGAETLRLQKWCSKDNL